MIDGKPFRFVGMNIRGLVHYGDKQFLNFSEEQHRIVQLDAARDMGARVVRVFLGNKLRSVAETAARLEATLALADQRDLYMIVAFTNIFNTVGFFPQGDEHFYTGEGDKLSYRLLPRRLYHELSALCRTDREAVSVAQARLCVGTGQ